MLDLFHVDDIIIMQLAFYVCLFLTIFTTFIYLLDVSNRKIRFVVLGNLAYLLVYVTVLLSINNVVKMPILVGFFDMLAVTFYVITIFDLYAKKYSVPRFIIFNLIHLVLLAFFSLVFDTVSILRMTTNLLIVLLIADSIFFLRNQGHFVRVKTYKNLLLNILLFVIFKFTIFGFRAYSANIEVGIESIRTSISVFTFIGVLFIVWINFTTMLINYDILNSQYKHLSMHDYLTNIPNRRSAMSTIENAVMEAKNNNNLYGLVLFDIDNFKFYNDEYGHDFGDEVLVDFVRNCKGLMRAGDLFARYGGDEFILLVRLKTRDELVFLINRIQSYFENTPLTSNDITLSFSIGKGYIDSSLSLNAVNLIDKIDKDLYDQKSKLKGD